MTEEIKKPCKPCEDVKSQEQLGYNPKQCGEPDLKDSINHVGCCEGEEDLKPSYSDNAVPREDFNSQAQLGFTPNQCGEPPLKDEAAE